MYADTAPLCFVCILTSSQKYGRPNEATPAKWTAEYTDYNAPAEGTVSAPVKETTSQEDVLSAPPVAPNGETSESMALDETPATNGDAVKVKTEEKDKKRKSKHDGETPEERAERKRRKKEKKEKKEKRKSGASKKEDDSEESD